MTDQEKIRTLQQELRDLEEENTSLRNEPKPPPSTTARHEVESLIFEVRRLKAQVLRCERLLKEYQGKLHDVVVDYHSKRPRNT